LFVNPTRLLVTCGIVLSTLLAAGCSRIPDTVRIGVAQPLSGPQGPRGNDMKHGVQLAVDELNAKGFQIDGHPVRLEVVAVDDQSDAVAGRAAARLLVDADVIAVVGHLDSAVSIAAAPVYAEAGIPQLAIATQPGYTQQNLPTTFRLVASAAQESKALGSFAATQIAGRRFAVVDDGLPYGRGLADQAANEIRRSGKPVAVRTSLPDGGDCAALLAQLRAAQVDVLVATLADGQLAGLIPQLVQAGLGGLQIVGSDTTKTERLPPAASGVRALFATSPVIEVREFVGGPQFLAKFRQKFGADPVYGAHYAYDAVYVLAAAMQRGGSVAPRQLLIELKHVDALAPVTNNMRFRNDGEQHRGVVSVYQARAGRWEPMSRSDAW
jgi:branched-chain amino acid transport system substrate-binding protein